jgi:hypothetical protein
VTTTAEAKEQDKPSQEERGCPQAGTRPSHNVGEVSGRIRHVGTERITLDDGTVLGLPWFFKRGPSELMKVGMMLKVKYEKRDEGLPALVRQDVKARAAYGL